MVEAYSSTGLVMALCVASMVSLCLHLKSFSDVKKIVQSPSETGIKITLSDMPRAIGSNDSRLGSDNLIILKQSYQTSLPSN